VLPLLQSPIALLIAQLVVIITAARVLGLLARRLHQPLVVAEIVAGILLGPSFFGLIAPAAKDALFPPGALGELGLLSQLGLVLFMFLIGLEVDLRKLRGRAQASVAISNLGLLISFGLAVALSLSIYPTLGPSRVPFWSFTLFFAAAMSVTAFPVLARILAERGLLRSKLGAVAITAAAVNDVLVWCVLAFAVAIVRSTGLDGATRTTALSIAYTLLMVVAVRPFLGHLAARARSRDGLTPDLVALIFVLLFLSSWATEEIGVHALFGAFLMGAITPRDGGFARALAEKIEDVVVIVLVPVFFALSGLRTEIGLLDSPSAWSTCALIILVACLGKIGGSLIAARSTGLGWREAGAVGVLMNTRGMMVLIVLNVGHELGVISPTLFTMLVLMALFTTFMTSPLLQWVYPADALVRDLAVPVDDPAAPGRGFGILICAGFDRPNPGMTQVARALLGEAASPGRLYAVELLRPTERTSTMLGEEGDPAGALDTLVEHGRRQGLDVRPLSFVSSDPSRDLCSVAEVKQIDLILLGWDPPSVGLAPLSAPVLEVIREANAEVGLLVSRGLAEARRILVPALGSPHDRAALALAARMTRASEARVTVLRAHPRDDAFIEALRGELGAARLEVRDVPPGADATERTITAAADGFDLLIVGVDAQWQPSQRSAALVAERLRTRCPISMLLVRRDRRAAPAPLPPPAAPALTPRTS
jgi:Kef-type K+ transport system membrane component KefB/nucleotide-binding universal stress UspA family protein